MYMHVHARTHTRAHEPRARASNSGGLLSIFWLTRELDDSRTKINLTMGKKKNKTKLYMAVFAAFDRLTFYENTNNQ